MTQLEIRNLSVSFGGQQILHDVNLAIEQKELIALEKLAQEQVQGAR
jgi:ABC-type sugar transport system ATPase subunit